jgi:cytochrome c peroxidase
MPLRLQTLIRNARVFLGVYFQSIFISTLLCSSLSSSTYAQTTQPTEASEDSLETIFSESDIDLIRHFGPWPEAIPHDAGNELSGQLWAEQLGEQLFNDPGLSGNGQHSCLGCHQPDKAFTDGLSLAEGLAQHTRNTQGLLNVGTQRWFGWDGGSDNLWAASLRPLLSDIEMGADIQTIASNYRTKDYVVNALDSSNQDIDLSLLNDEQFVVFLSKAIAAYSRTLTSELTTFDQFRTAFIENDEAGIERYPLSAKRGLALFLGDANCHVCHFGADFSNGEFHDTGRPFFVGVGQIDSGRYQGIKRVRNDKYNLLGEYNSLNNDQDKRKTRTVTLGQVNFGQWRTPSLRNLMLTAPFMHDGSLKTLRDVVDAYADIDPDRLHSQGESILKPLDLTDTARDDLVRFLETLSEPAIP